MERMTGDWKLLAADTDDSQLTCGGDRCVRDCCQAPCRSGTIDSSASQVAEQGRRRRGGVRAGSSNGGQPCRPCKVGWVRSRSSERGGSECKCKRQYLNITFCHQPYLQAVPTPPMVLDLVLCRAVMHTSAISKAWWTQRLKAERPSVLSRRTSIQCIGRSVPLASTNHSASVDVVSLTLAGCLHPAESTVSLSRLVSPVVSMSLQTPPIHRPSVAPIALARCYPPPPLHPSPPSLLSSQHQHACSGGGQ
jgi:hypothetical protein